VQSFQITADGTHAVYLADQAVSQTSSSSVLVSGGRTSA
jgi:hypothetical protein